MHKMEKQIKQGMGNEIESEIDSDPRTDVSDRPPMHRLALLNYHLRFYC